MKRKGICLRICVALLLLLAGFNLYYHIRLDRFEGVTMTAADGIARPDGVTVTIANDTTWEFVSSTYPYRLQVKHLGIWFPLWRDFTAGHKGEAFCYEPKSVQDIELRWKGDYGTRSPGQYRVLMQLKTPHSVTPQKKILLSAEFAIQ